VGNFRGRATGRSKGATVNLLSFFSSEEFMPHGHCFLWRPDLMSMHIVSDALIAIAYYTIPFGLIYFAAKRPDVLFRRVAVLFGIFILACGTTHVMSIVVLWHPIYWVDGGIKVITALSSIGTALVVWRVMPLALATPSSAQLQAVVSDLGKEVANRRRAEEEVRTLNADLEERVRLRTRELVQSNGELEAAIHDKEALLQEVHHRVKNNLQVVAALLSMQSESSGPELQGAFQDSISRIEAMGRIHNRLHRSPELSALDLGDYLATMAGDVARLYGRKDVAIKVNPPARAIRIDFEAANALVLLLNEALINVFKHAFPRGRVGSVEISFGDSPHGPAVSIVDDGVGLSQARGSAERSSVGLNLIHRLAGQIGAEIEITEDRGTRFTVRLPRSIVVADHKKASAA
jgi:two-component sensor histidine kinase